ncbi:MAG: hypothetical protein J4F42_14545 [Desulfurellaceae bacterium]|nr:hypothetical protein [Desulfurellaceae bacterium]
MKEEQGKLQWLVVAVMVAVALVMGLILVAVLVVVHLLGGMEAITEGLMTALSLLVGGLQADNPVTRYISIGIVLLLGLGIVVAGVCIYLVSAFLQARQPRP